MSVHDIKRPYMIYDGRRPRHPGMPEPIAASLTPPAEEAWREEPRRSGGPIGLVISAVAALTVGVGLGVWVTPLLQDEFAPAAPRAAVALAATPTPDAPPAVIAAAPSALEVLPETRVEDETIPAPVIAKAPARAADPPHKIRTAARAVAVAPPRTAGGCRPDASRAAVTLCADPSIAAADEELERVFQRALQSGVAGKALRADQKAWLTVREEAARRSPGDLAEAYEQRIVELTAIAEEPPH